MPSSIANIGKACTGCKLCETVCPNGSICFEEDRDGFWQPKVSDQCTNCGKCSKYCPVLNNTIKKNKPMAVYGGRNNDSDSHISSSSGGIFPLLANEILIEGGAVYGAVFDNNLRVIHHRSADMCGVNKMRGSKYVQSDCTIYKELLKDIEVRPVLFSGTPCQVAAVRSICNGNQFIDNLICVDFCCNSINSPKLLEAYKNYKSMKSGKKVIGVNFRDYNIRSTTSVNFGLKFTFDDNTESKLDIYSDPFYFSFALHYLVRYACYDCIFANDDRYSDITLADFWKVPARHFHPDGTSLLLLNTDKGFELFKRIQNKITLFKTSFEVATNGNPQLKGPIGGIKKRQQEKREQTVSLMNDESLTELFEVALKGGVIYGTAFKGKYILDRCRYFYAMLISNNKSNR